MIVTFAYTFNHIHVNIMLVCLQKMCISGKYWWHFFHINKFSHTVESSLFMRVNVYVFRPLPITLRHHKRITNSMNRLTLSSSHPQNYVSAILIITKFAYLTRELKVALVQSNTAIEYCKIWRKTAINKYAITEWLFMIIKL